MLGQKTKERQLVELVGDLNPGLEAPSESKTGQERSKRYVRGGGTARRESPEKEKPCLMNMMLLPLACMASRERVPDRDWVQLITEHIIQESTKKMS